MRMRSLTPWLTAWMTLWTNPLRAADARVAEQAAATARALIPTYQWFHTHPELSTNETETAARMAKELRAIGLQVHEDVGGHGLVAILEGSGPGPVVLYRADMDALPVTEATGLPYASAHKGVMHACGHDVHMTVALGTLKLLQKNAKQWRGTVLFVGQPAEETTGGARTMLQDPHWSAIIAQVGKPVLALALHDDAAMAAGDVAVLSGAISANVDSLDITLYGKGGHGSRPNNTIDPVVMAAETIMSLQTIVSRRVPPGEPAVVTVGQIVAGTKRNIIPPTAKLSATVRTFSPDIRRTVLDEINRVVQGISSAYGATKPAEVVAAEEPTPSVFNDPAWAARIRTVCTDLLGAKHVVDQPPTTGGEDFGLFGTALGVPSVMFWLGAVNPATAAKTPARELPGLHSDAWAPDAEPAIATGIAVMHNSILAGLTSAAK